jgi:dienelactone hydrolase
VFKDDHDKHVDGRRNHAMDSQAQERVGAGHPSRKYPDLKGIAESLCAPLLDVTAVRSIFFIALTAVLGAGCSSLPRPNLDLLPSADQTLMISVYSARRNRLEQVPVDVFKPSQAHPDQPAVIYMSGCGGVTYPATQGLLEQLRRLGVTIAILQSMRVEGRPDNFCVVPHVTGAARAEEVFLAKAALVQAGLAHEARVGLIGSSHGGWAISYAIFNEDPKGRPRATPPFQAAVAFYPFCQNLDTVNDTVQTPTLMLMGGRDDWTPPYHCEYLARRARPPERLTLHTFSHATHAWDVDFPPRTVPTGTRKGSAFMVYHPGVTLASQQMALEFLVKHMGLPTGAEHASGPRQSP